MLHTDLASSPDDRVLPRWGGRSSLNLITSLTAQLGLPPTLPRFSAALPLDHVQRVVLLLIDGLGHYLLDQHLERGQMPWLAEHLGQFGYQTATSTFPSSTMTALTTIHTGVPPSEHGWLGTSFYLQDTVIDVLRQTDLLAGAQVADPEMLITVPSVYRRLEGIGVSSAYVNPAAYEGQFLDRFYFGAGAPFRYGPLATMPTQVGHAAEQAQYVMAYWPDYDTTNHIHGPHSAASVQAAGTVDALIRQTVEALPQDGHTLLIVTADHGQRVTPPDQVFALAGAPVAGENRVRYFRERPQHLPAGVTLQPSAELWAAGVFGGPPARAEWLDRTGAFTAAVQDRTQLTYDYGAGPLILAGNHGGWSAEEMVVPVLSLRR